MVRRLVPAVVAAALAGGCQLVLGIEDRVLVAGAGGGLGAGGTGGGAGEGGAAGAGGGPCTLGAVQACYEGPDGTAGVGACKAGERACGDDGSGFGACEGATVPALEDCASTADDDCDGTAPACTGDVIVAATSGGAGDDEALAVALHASGDPVLVGVEAGAPRGDLTVGRAFVARRDLKSLAIGWSQGFAQGTSTLSGVACGTLGDVIVSGAVAGATTYGGEALQAKGGLDALVMKLDPATGVPFWARTFGDAAFDQVAEGLAVDRVGAAYVVGRFEGAIDLIDPPLVSKAMSGFLAKLDPAGATVWATPLPGTFLVRSLRVAVGAAGDPVVVGSFAGAVTIGARVHATTGMGDFDGFAAAFDGATGAPRWSLRFGDDRAQGASAVAIDAAGDVVVGGTTEGAVTVGASAIAAAADGQRHGYVMKLGPTGAFLWGARLGESGDQSVRGVAVDPLGAVLVTGTARGSVKLGAVEVATAADDPGSAMVAKLGPDGAPLWLRLFGDASLQRAAAVASRADARAVLVGGFAGALDPAAITSSAGLDAFVIAVAP